MPELNKPYGFIRLSLYKKFAAPVWVYAPAIKMIKPYFSPTPGQPFIEGDEIDGSIIKLAERLEVVVTETPDEVAAAMDEALGYRIGGSRSMRMTRKRAKKLLMSKGFTRNYSEFVLNGKRPGVRNERAFLFAHEWLIKCTTEIQDINRGAGIECMVRISDGDERKPFAYAKMVL